jgi:two-component system, OmpR family, sensor histidine kinase MtrB
VSGEELAREELNDDLVLDGLVIEDDDPAERGRPRRLGLRTMVTLSFSAGALLLSLVLSLGTYLVARHSLLDQRERSATSQAFADASAVRDGLRTSGVQVSEVLGTVAPPSNTNILVYRGNRWFSAMLQPGAESVPDALRRAVRQGSTAMVWTQAEGASAVVVGIPLRDVDAQYFEISATPELEDTLGTLRVVLGSFAALTALGGAALGRTAARRLVAPLDDIAGAAARISAGDLSTRLPVTDDPELATIVGSFNAMVEALDERIQRDARFAADLSHELRSPLTTLMTSVEVLHRRRSDLPQRSRQALDLIRVELDRFHQALEDLLELGRLDAGVGPRSVTDVQVAELVREAVDAAHRPAAVVRVDPTMDPHLGGHAAVRVDKQQLNRALWNLMENADRHGGGLHGIRVDPSDGFVLVLVDDVGPGVPAADRERIFERFYRAGSRGSRQGTGLGLSLVAETVQAHSGSVWCADRPGGGTRFVVRLPLADPEDPQ